MKGFNFYQDAKKEWRWNLKDGNFKIVADSGEGYKDRSDCEKSAELFKTLGPNAPVHKAKSKDSNNHEPEWEYYEDKAGEWRWRFQVRNNKTIADSSEGYATESNVLRAIENVKTLLVELAKETEGYVPPANGGSSGPGRFA